MLNKLKNICDPLLFSTRPPLCENILDWAIQRAWHVKMIHDPLLLEIPVPTGCTDPALLNRYVMHSRMGFPPQFLICIPWGVSCGAGFIRLASGEFLTESSWRPQYLLNSNNYRSRWHRHKMRIAGDSCVLHSFFGGNYGHWLYDEVPRLLNALPHLPANTQFIVPEPLEPWKLETLLALGIPESRLLRVRAYFEVHCERLWFATHLGDSEKCITAPGVASRVRKTFRDYFVNGSLPPASERLFVSRSKAAQHRLLNEEELVPVLRELGFAIVSPEEYSVERQVQMFRNASLVVGAFGAALTNLMFCPAGATLIELQDDLHAPRIWYWKLAHVLGHRYKTIVGKTRENRSWGDVRFEINKETFKKMIVSSCDLNTSSANQEWFD